MIIRPLNFETESHLLKDDPVRPHLDHMWRVADNRMVYVLDSGEEKPDAVICTAITDEVPEEEHDLLLPGNKVAVFYTVWSYRKGAGTEIVNDTAQHMKETKPALERYVTLSPLTEMARKFHIKNGAKFIHKGATCQNFEYFL